MPKLIYNDLTISVGLSGDFHVHLRSLDAHYNKEQIAQLIYPVLDQMEKALHPPSPTTPSSSSTGDHQ